MPTAKPLTNAGKKPSPAKPVTPIVVKPEPQEAAPVATVSPQDTKVIATAAKACKLPSWLQKAAMPQVADREIGGYIGFASAQAGKWSEQQQAGLSDGQPYLYHQQRYIPLKSLDFFLCLGESFQTLMVGREGKFQWVSRDLEEEGPTVGTNRPEPHYVCLLIVHAEGRLIPIKGDFRGTKSGGIEGAIRAVESAATPEWLKLSDAHRISAAFPDAFGRVFHRMTTVRCVSKTSGNAYFRANCTCNPSSVSEMQMLFDAFADEDFNKALADAKKKYEARIEFLDNIATNGPAKT